MKRDNYKECEGGARKMGEKSLFSGNFEDKKSSYRYFGEHVITIKM